MVGFQGHKMSKSLGNLVFVSTLRQQGTDPVVLRLALLSHHYREDWQWTDRDLAVAERRLERWRQALPITSLEQAEQLVVTVRAALAADLDTPRALRLLDDWAMGWHPGDGSGATVVRDLVDARLGLTL
jgi:L-cysteine:1D-myo-inositol 2-amino-2-deoxy-alpha-D-glucopyranoside ligase